MGLSEEIVMAVNMTLPKYCKEVQFQDYFYFYNLHNSICQNKGSLHLIESDKTILCEFNVGLWDKSFMSAIDNLTGEKYPHHVIVEQFLNYVLNADPFTNFELLENFFHRLLLLFPPRAETREYYQEILCGSYITLNGVYVEEQEMFTCLVEALFKCLNEPEYSESNHYIGDTMESQYLSELQETLYDDSLNDLPETLKKKNKIYYENLLWNDKLKRCLLAINFVYDIIETDFAFWLNSEACGMACNRPLICCILWPNKRDTGLCNKITNRIIRMFVLGNKLEKKTYCHFSVIKKFVNLLAEVVRLWDKEEEMKYPHLGERCNDLVRELSSQLFELFEDDGEGGELTSIVDIVRCLKPPWLKMLVSSHLISHMTGYQCSPELTTAYDVLSHLAYDDQENDDKQRERFVESDVDWKKVRKLRSRCSVNLKYKGKSRLQVACESNDVEEVKALLIFPELDVNGTDLNGWTALHVACRLGSEACVRQLLFGLHPHKSINIRAKGPENLTPLMCAAAAGHTEICHLLLQHSGSALLEDVNESNQTALELSASEEISRILEHYKKHILNMEVGSLRKINFDIKYKNLVGKLCVELLLNYFATHRTLDVCRLVNNCQGKFSILRINDQNMDVDSQWDYKRYERDIINNLKKLIELETKFVCVENVGSYKEILRRLLSLFNNSLAISNT